MTDVYKLFFSYIEIFFIIYMIGYASFLFLSVTVGSSTLYQSKKRNELKSELQGEYYIPVSIIVPAYNEEITIVESIRSLLALEYKLYEIIIVDDGSKDNTADVVQKAFSMQKISRPIQRKIFCQPEEAIYESYGFKVPITLIRKKKGKSIYPDKYIYWLYGSIVLTGCKPAWVYRLSVREWERLRLLRERRKLCR